MAIELIGREEELAELRRFLDGVDRAPAVFLVKIASALFVTPKTVGTQLSRIYRKVGVRSRTELARHLSEDVEAPTV